MPSKAKNQKTLSLPLNTLGRMNGAPALTPYWLYRETPRFWFVALAKNEFAARLEFSWKS